MTRLLSSSMAQLFQPKQARVVRVSDEGPRFLRVRFEGEALRGARFRPGMDVELTANGRVFRHQAPALFDAETGAMELVFFLCGEGLASSWIRALIPGAEVGVSGPGGGLPIDAHARYHVFLGDERSVGLEECLSRALGEGACWTAALETGEPPPSRAQWLRPGDADSEAVHRFLARQPRTSTFYLAGEAGAVQGWRRRLLALGVARRLIRTKSCGADGRQV